MTPEAQVAFDLLVGNRNLLWRDETRHEAMLLLHSLWLQIEQRGQERILKHILDGPPKAGIEGEKDDSDLQVFEILNFLVKKSSAKLSDEALERYQTLQRSEFSENIENPGMRRFVILRDVQPLVATDSGFRPTEMPAADALRFVLEYERTFEVDQRDVAEQFGSAIAKSPDWGLEALTQVKLHIHEISPEVMGPVLWGMRAAAKDHDAGPEAKIKLVLASLEKIVLEKPDPHIWVSLPTLLEELISKGAISIDDLNQLSIKLAEIFMNYDYEREEVEKPVEWIQRAINHPVGYLVKIYLKHARHTVGQQSIAKVQYALAGESRTLFEALLRKFGDGSRYGYCLLAEQVGWFDAVDHAWTDQWLLPKFDWAHDQISQVAWSGFLWSRTLYKPLVENFNRYYLQAVSKLHQFGSHESEGLARHLAAIFWFAQRPIGDLKAVLESGSGAFRVELVDAMQWHLPNSEAATRRKFFEQCLLPIWDWLGQREFLDGADGNQLRVALFRLVPFSDQQFTAVGTVACERPPVQIEYMGLLLDNLAESKLVEIDGPLFVKILIHILNADLHPQWNDDLWKKLWRLVVNVQSPAVEELKNVLAQKGIPDAER